MRRVLQRGVLSTVQFRRATTLASNSEGRTQASPADAVDIARLYDQILALKLPLEPSAPSPVSQLRQLLQQLGPAPGSEKLDMAFKAYEKVAGLSRGVNTFSSARLSMMCLNSGFANRALEPWTRVLEIISSKVTPKALVSILDRPENEPAALAALAAYFVAAGPTADPEVAHKLVPRQRLPSTFNSLKSVGKISNSDVENVALKGLANLQKHLSSNFTSESYLKQVSDASFSEVGHMWDQVMLASSPGSIPEVTYAAFISRLAKTRQTDKAFRVWQTLFESGVPITTTAWAALLKTALHVPENSEAIFFSLWDKMIKAGYTPNAECWTQRFLGLTRNRKLEQALTEFEELAKKPDQLGIQSVNVLVHGLSRAKRFAEADKLVSWAIEHGMKPTTHTYNSLIQAAASRPELAQRYLDDMAAQGLRPDIVTYTNAVEQTLRRGQPVGDLLVEMQKAGIKPNEQFNAVLAYGIGRVTKDVSVARETMATMLQNRTKASEQTLGAFIQLELSHGEVNRAVKYVDLFNKFGLIPNVPTYNQLIRGAIGRNRLDAALWAFDRLAGQHRRLQPNTFTYMFMLDPWTVSQLQRDPNIRDMIKNKVAPSLLSHGKAIDYPLARRIANIVEATGTELIPEPLASLAAQVSMELFNRQKASKA